MTALARAFWLAARAAGVKGAVEAEIIGIPRLELRGRIEIGRGLCMASRPATSQLCAYEPGAILRLGDGVHISTGVSIIAAKQITIGDNVWIGPYTLIFDTNFHKLEGTRRVNDTSPREVVIESDVCIGPGTIVLKGSWIGAGAVIAPGSVVLGFVPPGARVGGFPAVALEG